MEIGAKIGPYRILRALGQGGMGAVYEAVNDAIERRVAIKVLHPSYARHAQTVARFFNEARAVNRIEHPSLVQIHEHGQEPDGTAYIVMELLEGKTLAQRLESGALPVSEALHIAWQISTALAAAHDKEIVHRDLKPSNLMLVPDPLGPAGERVKVLDFGIAKLANSAEGGARTASQTVLGTPLYMSPEQCKGAGSVDGKADVYSLGCILFEMLAGRPPYLVDASASPLAVLNLHLHAPLPAIGPVAPSAPPEISRLVERSLAKEPGERPTMRALAQELSTLLGVTSGADLARAATVNAARAPDSLALDQTIESAPDTSDPPSARAPSRRRAIVVVAAAIGICVVSVAAWQRLHGRAPPTLEIPLTAPCAELDELRRAKPAQACREGYVGWCDVDGANLACCASGMVPHGREGLCDCAPGGVTGAEETRGGCPRAKAAVDREALRQIVRSVVPAIGRCFEAAQATNDKLADGKVVLRWLVGPDGRVVRVRVVASSLAAPQAQQCIADTIKPLRFPPPPGGHLEVDYPFELRDE